MKTITLQNPELAQEVFKKTYAENFYIKIADNDSITLLADAFHSQAQGKGIELLVKARSEYKIDLSEFGDEITISWKKINELGALLCIDGKPYLLSIYGNAKVEQIETIGRAYPELRIIDFGSAKNQAVQDLKCISACKDIKTLNLNHCPNLKDISVLPTFSKLETLWIDGFADNKQFQYIGQCSSLLQLSHSSLTELGHLTGLKNLRRLHLRYLDIVDLSPLGSLTNLTSLDLSSCGLITDLSQLSGLINLTNLNLEWCKLISDLSPLCTLTNLTSLDLTRCKEISDLSPLCTLSNLTSLSLEQCELISDLSPLSGLTNLTSLDLSGPIIRKSLIKVLNPLSALTNLTSLDLTRCNEISDLSPLCTLSNLTSLSLERCELISDLSPLSGLTNLTSLNLGKCKGISDISPLSALTNLNSLYLESCGGTSDLSPISGLNNLTFLDLTNCSRNSSLAPLISLTSLTSLNLSHCTSLTNIRPLTNLNKLEKLKLDSSPNIRDFHLLGKHSNLRELEWIDPVACSEVLMSCALNREDSTYIERKIEQWNKELLLCKDAVSYSSLLISGVGMLPSHQQCLLLQNVSSSMRTRGLQSENQNDMDSFVWEKWCALATTLSYTDAKTCLSGVVSELNLERETAVLLGPVIVSCVGLINTYPEKETEITSWVNQQLNLLTDYPHLERQVAPSSAVYFASTNNKKEVERWLKKATDEKAPLWRERVLAKLVAYYGTKQLFSEAQQLLSEMKMQQEKDQAIASLALAMSSYHPVDAAFLLDAIHEENTVLDTAKEMLNSTSVLAQPQGIYQLFLHLQNNTEEMERCLGALIEHDQKGKVAEAVKRLFISPSATPGNSAATFLLLCEHPELADYVKPRAMQKYREDLLAKSQDERFLSIDAFVSALEHEGLIDQDEMIDLTLALKK